MANKGLQRSTRSPACALVAQLLVPAEPQRSPTKTMKQTLSRSLNSLLLSLGCAPERGVAESSQHSDSAHSSDQPPDSKPSPEILKKRIEYRDTLRRVVEILERRYMDGTDNFTSLAKANIELAEAELAAASTQTNVS